MATVPIVDFRKKLEVLFTIHKDVKNNGQLAKHFGVSAAAVAIWRNGQNDPPRDPEQVPHNRIQGFLELFGLALQQLDWLLKDTIVEFEKKMKTLNVSSWADFLSRAPHSECIKLLASNVERGFGLPDDDEIYGALDQFKVNSSIKIAINLNKTWAKCISENETYITILTRDANGTECLCPNPSQYMPKPKMKFDNIQIPDPSLGDQYVTIKAPIGVQNIFVILSTNPLSKEIESRIEENTLELRGLEKQTLDILATELLSGPGETEVLNYSYEVIPA